MRRLKRLMAGLMAALLAASLAPAALASSGYDLLDILEEMYSEEQISFAPLLAATSEEDDSEDSEEQNETTAAPDTDYKHDSEGSAEITIGSVTEADGTAYVPIYVTASSGLNGVQMSVTYGDGLTYLSAESSKDFSWASVEEGSGKLSFMFANAQNVTTSASNLLLTTLEFAVDTDTYNPGTVISVSGSCDYVTYREDDEEANVIYTVIYDTVEISSGSVTVHTPAETPAIGTQPEAEAYYGQNSEASALTVTASVSDGGTLSYQWYSNSTNSTEGGTAIDGATNASYTPSTEQTGITYYYCTVVNTLNGVPSVAVTSDIAAVTVFTITVDPSSAEVNVGSRVPLSFSVSTITADTAEWSSSDEAVATVTSAGMVTGVSAGTATITATVYGVSATAEVTVNAVAVESIALNAETLSLTVGDNSTLTATVSPSNATDSTVTWTSSDASVATVDENGVVTAVAAGTATITAAAGECTANCTVTVTEAETDVAVTGITLDSAALSLTTGETATLTATVTPENATDKTVTWTSSDASVATVDENGVVTAVAAGTATITAAAGEYTATCEVTVTEATAEYTLGDVNGDGVINTVDATLVLQYYAKIITADTEGVTFIEAAADVNGNDVINTVDATLILQYYAKIITEFSI